MSTTASSRSAGHDLQNILRENWGDGDSGGQVTVKKLESCLGAVSLKIRAAKKEMRAIIESHHTQFNQAFELGDIATNKIVDAKNLIQQAFSDLSAAKSGLKAELKKNLGKYKSLVHKYQLSKKAMKVLGSLAQFHKQNLQVDRCLAEGKYVECANIIVQNETMLKELKVIAADAQENSETCANSNHNNGNNSTQFAKENNFGELLSDRVMAILEAEVCKKRTRILTRIKRCLSGAIQITTDGNESAQVVIVSPVLGAVPHHLHVSRPVPLNIFLQAAHLMGQFNAILGPLSKKLVRCFLIPAIALGRGVDVVANAAKGKNKVRLALAFTPLTSNIPNKAIENRAPLETANTSHAEQAKTFDTESAVNSIKKSPDESTSGIRRVEFLLSEVSKVFDVLYRHVLGSSSEFSGRLGGLLFSTQTGAGLENILVSFLKTALPPSLNHLDQQQSRYSAALEKFMKKLQEHGFIGKEKNSHDDVLVKLSLLASFRHDLALHFVKSERESMLRRARELISKDAFNSCEVGGSADGEWDENHLSLPMGGDHLLEPVFQNSSKIGNADTSFLAENKSPGHKARPVSFLSFPKCHVTASILHLIRLSEEVIV